MGQKSSPIGLRLQINRTWDSRWYAEGDEYGRLLLEDLKIRKFIMEALPQAAISKVVIERPAKLCRVSIYAARPGVIIGKKGADIEKLRGDIDFGYGLAKTAYGVIGIKVWVFKGETIGKGDRPVGPAANEAPADTPPPQRRPRRTGAKQNAAAS